jgi:hypothetical protein
MVFFLVLAKIWTKKIFSMSRPVGGQGREGIFFFFDEKVLLIRNMYLSLFFDFNPPPLFYGPALHQNNSLFINKALNILYWFWKYMMVRATMLHTDMFVIRFFYTLDEFYFFMWLCWKFQSLKKVALYLSRVKYTYWNYFNFYFSCREIQDLRKGIPNQMKAPGFWGFSASFMDYSCYAVIYRHVYISC